MESSVVVKICIISGPGRAIVDTAEKLYQAVEFKDVDIKYLVRHVPGIRADTHWSRAIITQPATTPAAPTTATPSRASPATILPNRASHGSFSASASFMA